MNKITRIIPDKLYIMMVYYYHFHKFPNLKHPQTLNEKIQWLKLYDRRPEYIRMVDKTTAKDYVAEIIGYEHIIPTLCIWDRAEDIDFNSLPNQFVLKCNHDSGTIVICRDKNNFDYDSAIAKLSRGLSKNAFWYGREWPYKNIKPRILAETYMTDSDDATELTDYKFYCFNGVVDCVVCCYERQSGDPKFYFFDRNWKLKRYNKRGKSAPENFTMPKPDNIMEMFDLAEKLAAHINSPFIRVDLYNSKGKIYFGELTLYPSSGFDVGRLPETDLLFGQMVKLPIDK